MLQNYNRGNFQSCCSSKKKRKTVSCGRIQVDCSCTKNSASSSSSSKDLRSTQRKNSKTCKSCGGKLGEHGPKSQQGSMVRNEGLELLKYIDPRLRWKRLSNGRQRTVRKARTSFIVPNILFSELKNKLSKESKDMSIAESEKVGVSILGRRFSDSLSSVPLKKRRHLPPSSLLSPHKSDDSSQASLKKKQNSLNVNLDSLLEESGIDKNLGVADFSNISLLADAACDSITGQASLEFQGSLKANAELVLSPNRNDRPLHQTSDDLGSKKDLPSDASSSSALYSEKSNEVKSDGSKKYFTNVSCKTLEFTSREVKFPWDLNAPIDENGEQESTYSGSENAGFDKQTRYSEQYMHQTNFGEAKNVHNNLSVVENREILSCEADMKHDIACFSQTEESKVGKMFFSLHTDKLAMDLKCESEDCKEAKSPINRNLNNTVPKADNDSTLVSETDIIEAKSQMNKNMYNIVPKATKGSEIDIIEVKAEACSVPFQLEVEIENPPSHLASRDNALSESHFGMDNRLVKAVGSLSAEQKSLYIDSSSHPEEKRPEVGVENHIECHKSSDLSQYNNNDDDADDDYQADETEKLEFFADDDSQYEDGELREPPANCQLVEGADEDGIEMVDYGPDGDTNTNNAVSDGDTRKVTSKSFDDAKKLSSPSSYRKMLEWEYLPSTCRNSPNKGCKYQDQYHLVSSLVYDSTNRAKPSFCRDISYQTDISTGNENSYVRRSRSSDRKDFKDFKPRVEMHRVDPRTLGRNRSSMHSQDRGRRDCWAGSSPKYHSNNQRDSFDYRSSRNAAAAAVAKIESNGFVVSPDGTIVKSNRARPTKDSSCQYTCNTSIGGKSSIGKSREISPDRSTFVRSGSADGYGHRMEAVNSFSSMQHSLSRKDRVYSPPRRRFPLSRSPSRSKTRSPHRWVSPRDRSPNFNMGSKVNRSRSDFGDDVINYDSLPRNYASPPHASRWNNGKKGFNHYRQGHRFDNDRSHGRGRQGGFSSSMNSRRFHETSSTNDDTRKRLYAKDVNMNGSWHDDGIGLLGQNIRQKSSVFQRREGTRNLNRDSPRRPREERGHFRNGKGGNDNADVKSFGVRDGDLDESQ